MAATHRFNVEAFTLLGIALTVTGLRLYARVSSVGFKGLWADDYLVFVAAVSRQNLSLLEGGSPNILTVSVLGRDGFGLQRGQLCARLGQQLHDGLLAGQSPHGPS